MNIEEAKQILSKPGLTRDTVIALSIFKQEPEWMLEKRLQAYDHYLLRPVPKWGANLDALDESKIRFYVTPESKKTRTWEEVPAEMKQTFSDLKIPEAERKFLAGVETQYDSNVVYGRIKEEWEKQGVVFTDTDTGLKKYPELFKKWFGKSIPHTDNKYAALNTACWSGGSFIYIPKGVKVKVPLQAYFYIKTSNLGQFERTLIIADEGAEVQYVEGCSAPQYSSDVLHSGVIELIALKGSRIRYTTIQNWAKNIYNLVTQRGLAYDDSKIEWVDCNIGSKVTMKYPSVVMVGSRARGEILSIAYADKGQHIDSGGKLIHIGKNTSGIITTKSICKNGGRTSYRGLVKVTKGAKNTKVKVVCDALILDDISQTDTYPYNEIYEKLSKVEHEASVSRVSENQLYYLKSRGITEEEAGGLIVSGFIEPIAKELPMEYAMEMNDLIKMSMKGSVG
ncbi:MAG: Fe-S cluster assembly protein SufB [Candidatus Dojkabacteria bacterium]